MGVKAFMEGREGCSLLCRAWRSVGPWATLTCVGQSHLTHLHASLGLVPVGSRISPSLEEPSQALLFVCLVLV